MSNTNYDEHISQCKMVLVPYWIIDALVAHNKPVSTLKNRDELSTILTGTDLDFYANRLPWGLYGLGEEQVTISLLEKAIEVVPPEFLFSGFYDREKYYNGKDKQRTYMDSDPTSFVRPLRDGVVHTEYPFLFDVHVIDDSNHESDDLILAITLRSSNCENDFDSEIACLDNFICLLSKYYGIGRIAKTPIMKRYIQLMQKTKK